MQSSQASVLGSLSWWMNVPVGEIKLYQCPGKYLGRNECDKIIPDSGHVKTVIFCPACNLRWSQDDVIGELIYRQPLTSWAEVVVKFYQSLGGDSDIFVRQPRGGLIKATVTEQEKFLGGKMMDKAKKMEKKIYPLAHIIKDTSAGKDLYANILGFLRS